MIEATLDEPAAERIYSALRASGATSAAHWRQALLSANGLTLEFTHLLTSGRRLADVLGEQVRARIADPNRGLEVALIGLVAAAHRWGAYVGICLAQHALSAPDAPFRLAVARLQNELLLHVEDGRLVGLHQLRSAALSEALWHHPPPTVLETAETLIGLVDDDQLVPLVAAIVTEHQELAERVVARLASELVRRDSLTAWIAALHGLRIVDFRTQCDQLVSTMDRLGVSRADRMLTAQLAMIGTAAHDYMKPEIRRAIQETESVFGSHSPLRDQLARLCLAPLSAAACGAPLADFRRVLGVLQGTQVEIEEAFGSRLIGTPLESTLRSASCPDLGDTLATAVLASRPLALRLFDLAGGAPSIEARLMAEYEGLVDVDVAGGEARVARARAVHVDDESSVDPDALARQLAKVLLRVSPTCESVDLEIRLPGDIPIQVGDGPALGISHLSRRSDHPTTEVAWNRLRVNIAATAYGLSDTTSYLAEVRDLLADAQKYLNSLIRHWSNGILLPRDRAALFELRSSLTARADRITAPVTVANSTLESVEAVDMDGTNSPAHGLVRGLVENATQLVLASAPNWAALAALFGDHLRSHISRLREERWWLLGHEAPTALEEMDDALSALSAVLVELDAQTLTRAAVRAITNGGPRPDALRRLAAAARRWAEDTQEEWARSLEKLANDAGLDTCVYRRPRSEPEVLGRLTDDFAIGIRVTDLTAWGEAATAVSEIVHAAGVHYPSRGPVLTFPLVGGRPVALLARSIITNAYPTPDRLADWTGTIPPAWPTPLTDAIIDAHRALQAISGLGILDAMRGNAGIDETPLEREQARFRAALDSIDSRRLDDRVVHEVMAELIAIAERVVTELEEGKPAAETFAAAIARGVSETPTPESNALDGLILLGLIWDTDRTTAQQLLFGEPDA